MGNYQKELMDIMVEKVLNKYDIRPSTSLTKKEKKKVKEVAEKIQAEVEQFLENQSVKVSEKDFPNKSAEKLENNQAAAKPIKKFVQDKNNVDQVRTFINKRNK